MNSGLEVLEGMVLFLVIAFALSIIGPPIILIIIWISRIKCGRSKVFGPLGIITIIVTTVCLLYLPTLVTMIGDYYGWF